MHAYHNVFILSFPFYLMAHDRITLPSSGGGVLRYSDSSKSKLEFSPYVVVGFAVAVIIIELILRAGG